MYSLDCSCHQPMHSDSHTCHCTCKSDASDCERLHSFHVHDNDHQHTNNNGTQHDRNHGDDHATEHGTKGIDNGRGIECRACHNGEHQTPSNDNACKASDGHSDSLSKDIYGCELSRTSQPHNAHVTTNENPTQHEHNNKDLSRENSRPFGDKKHDFDLVLVLDSLRRCPLEGGDVDLSEYLVAYRELCRFFKLTGRLFGFVAKDLEGKLAVIEQKMDDKLLSTHYTTVKTMVCYEQEHSITFKKGYKPSGSRTLLRLHWALEFILEFMKKLSTSSDYDKTSLIASEVYHKTLSHHHPWITRKMAALAMYLLPTRKDLIGAMCKQDYDLVIELLDEVVQAGNVVYDSIQDIFAYNNILNIP